MPAAVLPRARDVHESEYHLTLHGRFMDDYVHHETASCSLFQILIHHELGSVGLSLLTHVYGSPLFVTSASVV